MWTRGLYSMSDSESVQLCQDEQRRRYASPSPSSSSTGSERNRMAKFRKLMACKSMTGRQREEATKVARELFKFGASEEGTPPGAGG